MTYKTFRNTVLTNKGFDISNKASIGKTQFEIFKAVSTDADLTGYKVEDLKNLTTLPNEINSGHLTDYDTNEKSISAIQTVFDNSDYKDGYLVRAAGLYGKDADGNVFLHSITISDSPVVIPAVSSNIFDGLKLLISIISTDSKNMNVNLEQTSNASIHYVDQAVSKIRETIQKDIQPKLDDKLDTKDFNALELSSRNGNLYYQNKTVLTATKPNGVHIDMKYVNIDGKKCSYQINVENDGGSPIKSYTIFYKSTTDSNWSIITNASKNGSINLTDNTDYQVKAQAINDIGNSDDSEVTNFCVVTDLNKYIDISINTGSNMTQNYYVNATNNFQNSTLGGIKLYVFQTHKSSAYSINQSKGLVYDQQVTIDGSEVTLVDVKIQAISGGSNYVSSRSGYYLKGQNGWHVFIYAEALDANGVPTGMFTSPVFY
ncbi:fibronectin type III domain-containing protein [Apilactobacillus timberlakei]|uniref:Fibronectin type III domain-containing protein n=1 Tax=Apilactobacillus timberlakei TaxID=2008380 RepID=A0ABY2YVB1_9LACO|nr:fibronectin type III domain-containing protein [Apilactobacillus timberlakei]TPR12406.1 fibronectin type III domain-containing protein [Apilactobacillus timberlakei]TPR12992.1 fibronectin type III domain-containing protein [Apilactobacillus timberlakei]